jgi:hypothetical protein
MTKESCRELKNIEYQTMLLNHSVIKKKSEDNDKKIELYLNSEKKMQKGKTWSKLEKAHKLKKISLFVVEYSKNNELSQEEQNELKKYLLTSLHRKKLQRVKDVIYDIQTGKIKNIPGLSLHTDSKGKRKFTLRKIDKKSSTSKGLVPKKISTRKTKKTRKKKDIKKKEKKKRYKKKDIVL